MGWRAQNFVIVVLILAFALTMFLVHVEELKCEERCRPKRYTFDAYEVCTCK